MLTLHWNWQDERQEEDDEHKTDYENIWQKSLIHVTDEFALPPVCTLSNKSAQLQIELLKIVIYYYVFINYIFY